MPRLKYLKYAVASYVVLSSFHRLSNEKFIIQSFSPNHNGGGGGAIARNNNHTAVRQLRQQQQQKFCPYCPYQETTCIDHVHFLMRQFQVSEEEVKRNKNIASRCSTPYAGDYEFCPHCTYSEWKLCADQVKNLVENSNAGTTEENAMNGELVRSRCEMPRIGHNVYATEDEPSIILHVGPHKTGTTALQSFIYHLIYTNNETVFLRDNLRIPIYDELPGVFAKEGVGLNLPHCMVENYKRDGGQMNPSMCDPMRKAFPEFLRDAYDKGQNVLIVAEDFDRKEIDYDRLQFYLRPYKRVKVLVGYRRLHDWLPSWYNQIVDHYSAKYAQDELYYPSFVEWLDKTHHSFMEKHAIEVAARYRRLDIVESVEFLNIHQIPDLIEYFFCTKLRAKAVCQAIKDGAKPPKLNIGTDHEYGRVAIKASLVGKIKANLHRPLTLIRAARQLKSYVEKNGANETLPRICPAEKLSEKIFRTERKNERKFFPEWYEYQGGDEGLRKSFDAAVKKKFCSYDTDKILEMGLLDSIFKDM